MSRCALCPGVNKCIQPDGPEENRRSIIFIGEAPGSEEEKRGRCFIGKTGQEVNEHYMPLAGLSRPDVRVLNAIRCLPTSAKGKLDPSKQKDLDLLYSCAEHHLYPELERNNYKVIVPMGSFACKAIDPELDLEFNHGLPVQTAWGTVFPMYHPAGGIHEPKKMLHIRTDWIRLRKYLAGKLHKPVDPYEGIEDYRELTKPWEVDEVLEGMHGQVLACDTETDGKHQPFCITFSAQPGTGYLIRATKPHCLEVLQENLEKWTGKIIWHNWLFDSRVVDRMGLKFNRDLIVDTMVMCFHLGNVPQGLKALCYRELGINMSDFMDVVKPFSDKRILDYYKRAQLEEWQKPEPELVRDKDGKWKMYSGQSMSTKLKRFFTDYAKNELKDPAEMWEKNWADWTDDIEAKCGPWPGVCITHAAQDNWEKVLRYSCQDADGLGRLYPILLRAKSRVRRKPQEHWMDK